MNWTLLSATDNTHRPSGRQGHGFTSAGGLLYVHGGNAMDIAGDYGDVKALGCAGKCA